MHDTLWMGWSSCRLLYGFVCAKGSGKRFISCWVIGRTPAHTCPPVGKHWENTLCMQGWCRCGSCGEAESAKRCWLSGKKGEVLDEKARVGTLFSHFLLSEWHQWGKQEISQGANDFYRADQQATFLSEAEHPGCNNLNKQTYRDASMSWWGNIIYFQLLSVLKDVCMHVHPCVWGGHQTLRDQVAWLNLLNVNSTLKAVRTQTRNPWIQKLTLISGGFFICPLPFFSQLMRMWESF